MAGYRNRAVDAELDELMPDLAAVAIDGAKGVGKTETALRRAATAHLLDDPQQAALFEADPRLAISGEPPVLIDEWQRVVPIWDTVRRAVDRGAAPGSFLLTGSATPAPGAPMHSGAGRIVRIRMRPMALFERTDPSEPVSLARLLEGDRPPLGQSSDMQLPGYVQEIVGSGFPGLHGLSGRPLRSQLDGYLQGVVDRDLPEDAGALVRRPAALIAWMRAYAAATATTTSYNKILDAATPGDGDKPTKVTATRYRDLLERLWLLDPLPAWQPGGGSLGTLQRAPKHHLADPALAARLLGASAESMLPGGGKGAPAHAGLVGPLFESLATLSVRVAAQSAEASVSHLRTSHGEHEVDLIAERADGRIVAIEVKLAGAIDDEDVGHLHWLQKRYAGRVADAIVLSTGPRAYRRPDGIAVIPLALLAA